MSAPLPKWAMAWARSPASAYVFVTEVLGYLPHGADNPNGHRQLEKWQDDYLRGFLENDRHSVRSGHSIGKGTMIAWIMLWFVLCHKDAKGVLIAVSWDQMTSNNWAELRKQMQFLPEELQAQIGLDEEKLYLKCAPSMSFFVRRAVSKDKPEALQGLHAEHVLAICDEASGIDDIVFEIAESSSMATKGARWCLFSNPTRSSGYFFRTHHELRARWSCWHVNCEDVPRARNHISDIIEGYGRDSNVFRVRVAGLFPIADDTTVIPLEHVEAAITRDVEPMKVRPVWGLDVARFGSDRSALAKRRGNTLLEPVKVYSQRDTMALAGIIVREFDDTEVDDRPVEICIDTIGIGAGVYDRLEELGLPVRAVNVAESPSVDDQYMRLRDELWWKARKWFTDRNCKIMNDAKLIAELTALQYTFTSAGKLKVESKDDAKKRGLRSPDLADAFVLTFAADDRQRMMADRDRHRQSTRSHSGWAA
jgi:phage terminase large subunit